MSSTEIGDTDANRKSSRTLVNLELFDVEGAYRTALGNQRVLEQKDNVLNGHTQKNGHASHQLNGMYFVLLGSQH
jgi:hypothetical protein